MNEKSSLIEAHIFRIKGNNLEFLLLKRSPREKYPGLWQMVTGSVEKGEKSYRTALREIKEETGIIPLKFWIVPNVNTFYSVESDEIFHIPVFAALADINCTVIISDEHCDYRWVGMEEAAKMLAWPGQIRSVEIINEYFFKSNSILNFIEISL